MIRAALILAALGLPASAELDLVDGDTIRWSPNNLRLTLRDGSAYDTPESHPGAWECPEEKALGDIATARLRELTVPPVRVVVHVLPGTCGFGRGCAWIEADGRDAGAVLLSEGLAMPSRNFDWCGEIGQ